MRISYQDFKRFTVILILVFSIDHPFSLKAQVTLTLRSGTISFFSSTPLEDIKAENESFSSSINPSDSSVIFSVNIRGFNFRKKLMQEHFNDDYMESKKYPTAVFKGKLDQAIPSGAGPALQIRGRVKGSLTIRGVTRELNEPVVLIRSGENFDASCEFMVRPADFGIKIPRMVIKNIAEEVKVTINASYLTGLPK